MPGKRIAGSTRRSRTNKLLAALVIAAAAAALTLAGLSWFLLSDDGGSVSDGEDEAPAEATPADGDATQSADGASDEQASTILELCSEEITAAEAVLEAADAGVGQWKAHVQARTAMLEGRISEETMDAIWKRTQDAGPADVQRFDAARQAYNGQSSCGGRQNATGSRTQPVLDCLARSDLVTAAVSRAEAAMDDWASHLHHMSEYADGGMTSGRAQRLWVSAWRQAPENISAYEGARATARRAPTCGDAAD